MMSNKFSILATILLIFSTAHARAQILENGIYDTNADNCSFRIEIDPRTFNMVAEVVDTPRIRCEDRGRTFYFTYQNRNSFVMENPVAFTLTKQVIRDCRQYYWCNFFRDPSTKKPIAMSGDTAEVRIVFKVIHSQAFIYDHELRLMRGGTVVVDWTFQNSPNLFSKRGTGLCVDAQCFKTKSL